MKTNALSVSSASLAHLGKLSMDRSSLSIYSPGDRAFMDSCGDRPQKERVRFSRRAGSDKFAKILGPLSFQACRQREGVLVAD